MAAGRSLNGDPRTHLHTTLSQRGSLRLTLDGLPEWDEGGWDPYRDRLTGIAGAHT